MPAIPKSLSKKQQLAFRRLIQRGFNARDAAAFVKIGRRL